MESLNAAKEVQSMPRTAVLLKRVSGGGLESRPQNRV
jgi:hypothetical protein